MASDEPLVEDLSHVSGQVWRVWAVSLGFAFILGRLYFVQETHQTSLANLLEASQILKTELESVKTQTQTYQEGAAEARSTLRDRVNRLEDRQ